MMNLSSIPQKVKLSSIAVAAFSVLAAMMAHSQATLAATKAEKVVVYAGNGTQLAQYDLDLTTGALTKRSTVTLSGPVTEGFVHPSRKYLYISGSRPNPLTNIVSAYRIDAESGALTPHGQVVPLPTERGDKAGYVSAVATDRTGKYLLASVTDPSSLTVYKISADGTLGDEVKQMPGLEFGHHPHFVRMDPTNKTIILPTRGDSARSNNGTEVPGALKLFSFKDGVIANSETIAPNGGFGYQIRHMDFHPSGKWDYFTLEVQQQILVYERKSDGTLNPEPKFTKDSLSTGKLTLDCQNTNCGQALGSIRVDSAGKFLYAANRGTAQKREGDKRIYTGGENTIAVFAIDQKTGEPTLIQSADTHGFGPRTFAIDPTGKFLIATNIAELIVREGGKEHLVKANLSVFHIGADGKLTFLSTYDAPGEGGGQPLNQPWVGMTSLP
jgi:6-phosphogluconolactonase (cycloisomerase 2 family)